MSKSTGNFATIRELIKRHDPEVVRFFVVRAHYRSLSTTPTSIWETRARVGEALHRLKGRPSCRVA